jgi:hypothetical protein
MAKRRTASRRRKERRAEERQIEMYTFAAVVILFAVATIYDGLDALFITFLGAVILLGSGFYQRERNFRVNPITWVGGLILAIVAFMGYTQNRAVPMGMLLPFLVMGGVIAASFFTGEL